MKRAGIAEQLHRDIAGPLVRVADSATAAPKKYELLVGVVTAVDPVNNVVTLNATPTQLPTGAKALPTGTVKVYNIHGITVNVSDIAYAIHQTGVYDDTAGSNTHGVIDWRMLPFGGSDTTKTLNFQLYQDSKTFAEDSCEVKLCDDELNVIGDPVTVYDPHNEFSSGGSETAYGRCTLVRDADTGDTRLEITHLQNIAQIIYGTLDEDMGYVTTNVTLSTDATGFGPSFERSPVPATVHLTGDPKLVGGMRAKAAYVAVLEDPDAETPLYRIIAIDWNHINVQLIGNKAKSDGTRTCYICEDDLSPTTVEVTVNDPHLTFEGLADSFGVAKWVKDESTQLHRLEFEHINLYAEFIQGTLTTDMSTGTGTATVNTYFGGHFEGQSPGSSATVVSGVDCHDDLVIGDEVVAVRYNSLSPTYMIISGCPVGGTDLTPGCGIIIEDGTIELDPTIACDGLYWDAVNCCMGVNLPPSGYLYIDGSGYLDVDIPTITVNSFESCELAIVEDELVLTIKYKPCTVHAPSEESCGSETESTCSLQGYTDCSNEEEEV